MGTWNAGEPNVIEVPSGKRVRVRSWRDAVDRKADVSAVLTPVASKEFSASSRPSVCGSEMVTIDWPDYRLPRRTSQALKQLQDLWARAESERVEITSGSGIGRAGTALAIFLIIDGMSPADAIDWVHEHYSQDAISSHAQRGFLMDFQHESERSYN
ncbi:MAG: protein-tyrosine phosphatase family protein [Actinomycetaceae bacterium]|nr:hypothetical protein [Arcanobacterium sp.]MDD7504800.1 protein-tyrosine phosphatase family protein [Actinomycetaceae bacterium]